MGVTGNAEGMLAVLSDVPRRMGLGMRAQTLLVSHKSMIYLDLTGLSIGILSCVFSASIRNIEQISIMRLFNSRD
ncbi:MAG: hypothetical protein A3J71_01540 [Pseudomonadales bacterium RIFCSPHIGHO2_02_FULL_60_43]|jgi:hypothetical protein|nr:MAG: hypothetical protein A3J71_01540 [Pseudomonadales bacterium RIFCSPHIGHO2_02_FULL_60_43]